MSSYDRPPASSDEAADPVDGSGWRRQTGFLGVALAVASAVIAAGLMFAPRVSAYSGISSWVVPGLIGFILVLVGSCLVFAASLTAASASSGQPAPPPPPPAVAGTTPHTTPPAATAVDSSGSPDQSRRARSARRVPTVLGAVLGAIGLALAAVAVALAVLLPSPTETIMVQFTDLYGRVQLEYCPTLPASFEATAAHQDLLGSSTILPVKVTAETCGNADYTDGVWIYLNRDAVTISDRP
jgi:hypothetical protein